MELDLFEHQKISNEELISKVKVEELFIDNPNYLIITIFNTIVEYYHMNYGDVIDWIWKLIYIYLPEDNGYHYGDCVNACSTCVRCFTESLYYSAKDNFEEWKKFQLEKNIIMDEEKSMSFLINLILLEEDFLKRIDNKEIINDEEFEISHEYQSYKKLDETKRKYLAEKAKNIRDEIQKKFPDL